MGKVFLAASIASGVISQLLIKWRIDAITAGADIPQAWSIKIPWLVINVLFDRFIILSMFLTFLAGVLWMATLSKLEISFAYPFTSLTYVLVLAASCFLFGEPLNGYKIVGALVVIAGLIIASQG
ncbi:MAG: EamA family transporter [Candidatus Adiutrix sp.]|jgi:drug/metabolite transporter (DMT)-like permease|nr:EamA family transporter [Candidatus Adiutrix sp.]